MTRKVVPNHQVIHLWANQSQSEARSGNGNLWFEGPSLYSYRTEIARHVTNERGDRGALLSTHHYSVTTNQHQPGGHVLPPGVSPLYVDQITFGLSAREMAEREIAKQAERYVGTVVWRKRRRTAPYDEYELSEIARRVGELSRFFDLPAPTFDPMSDWREICQHIADRNERNQTPQAVARREREAAARVQRWLSGENVWLGYQGLRTPQGGAYLRVNGNGLETSLGASVPLKDAKRVFRMVQHVMKTGQAWHSNGERMPVGAFNVTHITPDGTMRAGCHLMFWPEIEYAARQAGMLNDQDETV